VNDGLLPVLAEAAMFVAEPVRAKPSAALRAGSCATDHVNERDAARSLGLERGAANVGRGLSALAATAGEAWKEAGGDADDGGRLGALKPGAPTELEDGGGSRILAFRDGATKPGGADTAGAAAAGAVVAEELMARFSRLPLLLLVLLVLKLRAGAGLELTVETARAWLNDGKLPKPGGGGAAAALDDDFATVGAVAMSWNPGGGGSVTRAAGGAAAVAFGDARDRRVDVSGGRLTDTAGAGADVDTDGAAEVEVELVSNVDVTTSAGEGVRDRSCAGVDGSVASAAAPQPPPVARGGGSLSNQLSWEEEIAGDGAEPATPAKDVGAVGAVGGEAAGGRDAVNGGDAEGRCKDEEAAGARRVANAAGSRREDEAAGVGSVGVQVNRCAGGGGPSCRASTSSRVSTSSG